MLKSVSSSFSFGLILLSVCFEDNKRRMDESVLLILRLMVFLVPASLGREYQPLGYETTQSIPPSRGLYGKSHGMYKQGVKYILHQLLKKFSTFLGNIQMVAHDCH